MKLGLGLSLPGVAAMGGKQLAYVGFSGDDNISFPDAAALDITGDLDVRVLAALTDWTPGANTAIVSKFNAGTDQRSWWFGVAATTGVPRVQWSVDGTAVVQVDNAAAFGVTDNVRSWVRFTLDADNGAGGHDVAFYKSADGTNGSAWTQVGATVTTAGTASIFNSTAELRLGALQSGGAATAMSGRMFAVQIHDGIDGSVVLDWDRTANGAGNATTGQTPTYNGTPTYGFEPR